MITIEIACNGYASAVNAVKGGAHRIELFENLAEGGCTPSAGVMHLVKQLELPVYVMIRPRGGDFHYNTHEIDAMLYEVEVCKNVGVTGIVFGCLNAKGEVDKVINKMLLDAWGGPATFHRAIDRSADILKAAHAIADLGFERILSSGGALHVMQGLSVLKQMQTSVGHLIKILPGAGVTASNAEEILTTTGCAELHATCKITIPSNHGISNSIFQETVQVSGVEEVRGLVGAVSGRQ
jgi:copper homeostasis protein